MQPSLTDILRTKLIPWSQQDASERFIVARKRMRQADMPYGVQLIPHKIQSRRVVTKDRRTYKNMRNIIALWPEARLIELEKHVLICVLDGSAEVTLGNYKVRCGSGHFIFIPPGIPHFQVGSLYVDLEKSDSCNIITFLLHPGALEYWTGHSCARESKIDNQYLVLHENVISLLQVLMKEVSDKRYADLQVNEKLLNLFLEVLLYEVKAGQFQSIHLKNQAEQKIAGGVSLDFTTHLELYVQTNLRNSLTLNSVAREMHFSPRHFARIIHRETGKNFNEYLAEQRLKEAKTLLSSTDWTVATIASMAGFKSPSYFRTFFKQYIGMTPTAYRLNAAIKKK